MIEEKLTAYWDSLIALSESPGMTTRVDAQIAELELIEFCGGEVEARAAKFARSITEQIDYELGIKDKEDD